MRRSRSGLLQASDESLERNVCPNLSASRRIQHTCAASARARARWGNEELNSHKSVRVTEGVQLIPQFTWPTVFCVQPQLAVYLKT